MENQTPQNSSQESKVSTMLRLMRKNKLVTLLSLIIVLLIVGLSVQHIDKNRLISEHATEMKNATMLSNEELATVFTWSVRSELMRGNQDNVDQLFLRLIKNKAVTKVQLIDPDTKKVTLSTDKKDEGLIITDTEIANTKNQKKIEGKDLYTVVMPVISIDRIIGIVLVEFKK